MCESLSRLDEVASTLKEAELRILLHLVARASRTESVEVAISSRTLSANTKLARPNGQKAVAALIQRGLLSSDGGSATRASTFRLEFLVPQVLSGRGFVKEPPPAQTGLFEGEGGIVTKPPLASEKSQGGIVTKPPPHEESITSENRSRERVRAPGSIDSDSNFVTVIDRALKAKISDYDEEQIVKVRNWLRSYQAKFGRESQPHAPDDRIVAQFLSIAPMQRLETVLYDLMAERVEPGTKYAWYVTVAMQRIHGISAPTQGKIKAQLELVRRARPAPAVQQPLAEEPFDETAFRAQVRAAAAGKGMR